MARRPGSKSQPKPRSNRTKPPHPPASHPPAAHAPAPAPAPPSTPPSTPPKRLIVWIDPAQVSLVADVAARANAVIVAAGSPTKAQTGAVAAALAAEPISDLRVALTEGDADAVLIGALGDFGRSDAASDAAALLAARAREFKVLTMEPFPLSAIDLASRGWLEASQGARPAEVARFIPQPRHNRAFRDASEILTSFGPVRSLAIEALAHPADGTLAARLVGALDLVAMLMGEPDSIDAAFCSPLKSSGLHAVPGESLADLHGDLTVNLRFAGGGGRAASIYASDQGGAWTFSCVAIGSGGRLRLHDHGFEWHLPTGEKADESVQKRGRSGPKDDGRGATAASVIADAVSRALDPHLPDTGPMDWASVLSMAQAVLLSTRTGQGESPQTFRAMLGASLAM